MSILPLFMGKHWDFTNKYFKWILNVGKNQPTLSIFDIWAKYYI